MSVEKNAPAQPAPNGTAMNLPETSAAPNGIHAPFAGTQDAGRANFGGIPVFTRVPLLVVIYSAAIVAAHWVAYLIRFEFHPPHDEQMLFWGTLQWM